MCDELLDDHARATESSSEPEPADRGEPDNTIFDAERLWHELSHPDHERRHAALAVMEALADLADLRADKYQTTYTIARLRIFDAALLDRDLADPDPVIAQAARRVRDELRWVAALGDRTSGGSRSEQ